MGLSTGYRGSHVLLSVLIGLGTFLDGYDLLNISIVLPFLVHFMRLTPEMQGLLGTTTYIGGVFGALVFGVFSDLRGRRVALLSDISFFLVSSFLSAFVTSPGQLLALRFLVGFGIGADIVSGPALLSEESPTPRRGLLLGVSLIMMPLGGLVSALLAHVFLTMGLPPGILWRIILGAGAIPAAIVILLRSRLPESTRWLLRGAPGRRRMPFNEVWRGYWRMLIYSSAAWVGAGTTSIFTIFTPMLVALRGGGYGSMLGTVLLLWVFATLGALLGSLMLDRVGRRILLMASLIGLGIAFWYVAITYRTPGLEYSLSLAMFMTFLVVSGAYTVQTEVFPVEVKSLADGIAFSLNRIANFVFGALTPMYLYVGLTTRYLGWVGVFVLIMAITALFTGMETARKDLEEIERLTKGNS
ncbi:MFS transporter [Vulcanisaeta souniana]|uniref:MFS transporter n=1 Tax=Vulcanisaeta souniana JCM 11219 TaxID=1293586 RepID=A0A830EKG7_9CREN|nr:MFS transporter [Vulcanisaeta souniana]BDR91039.1 MFS transporter [Vulcanisaeta souniana JCM 11219]GGI80339.1 MFS transporter [Vulcanisaeta souniana JCM 11219]